jgi:hypothetical protein
MFVCVCVCLCVCVFLCVCVCTYVCKYACIHGYNCLWEARDLTEDEYFVELDKYAIFAELSKVRSCVHIYTCMYVCMYGYNCLWEARDLTEDVYLVELDTYARFAELSKVRSCVHVNVYVHVHVCSMYVHDFHFVEKGVCMYVFSIYIDTAQPSWDIHTYIQAYIHTCEHACV